MNRREAERILDSDGADSDLPPVKHDSLAKARNNAYLHAKGIAITKPMQLKLLFPNTLHEGQGVIPNDIARSALFTARNKREPRRAFQHVKLFHLNDYIVLIFTGIELRAEDDELVWEQILRYAMNVPLGDAVDFTIKQLVEDVGWAKNGRYYDKARECISRLKANEIWFHNAKAYGQSPAISLIQQYTALNDSDGKPTSYRVWIAPALILLFAGNTFTNHPWGSYRDLAPVARRLADYIESHKHPYPLPVEKFARMCDSRDSSEGGWRRTVRAACAEIVERGIAKSASLARGTIYIVR